MKFILPLSLFIVGAFAEPILTCENQKECISIDVNKVTDDTCDDGGCVYKICVSDDRSPECVKGTSLSSTWSHICDGGDSTFNEFSGCPRDQSPDTNFWDSSEVTNAGGWEMCQYVTGGETAYFLMKDGNGCSPDGVEGTALEASMTTSDPDVTASCAPSAEGVTQFDDGNGFKTCTGNGEGVECIWTVVAPTCTAPVVVVDPTPAPVPVAEEALVLSEPICDHAMLGNTESTYCEGNGIVLLQAVGVAPPAGVDIIWDVKAGATGDAPTILFKVDNPFASEADIYIQYEEKEGEHGAADGMCVNQMNVLTGGCNLTPTEVEAACTTPTGSSLSFSIVSIYFVTNDGTVGLGGAEVNECCHEADETKLESTPVVEYTYEIHCACPATTDRNLRGGAFSF
jgi:hypothetical protein